MTRRKAHHAEETIETLEADAMHARDEVARAIGSLRNRLPEMDEVEQLVEGAAHDAVSAARRNPGPTLLLGACAAWLTYDLTRRGDRRRGRGRGAQTARREKLRAEIAEMEDRMGRLRDEMEGRAAEARSAAAGAVDDAGDALRDGARRAAHAARDGSGRAAEAMERGAREAGRHARDAGRHARDEAEDAMSSHPFASAAMAFALGAVVSAAARGRDG